MRHKKNQHFISVDMWKVDQMAMFNVRGLSHDGKTDFASMPLSGIYKIYYT